MAGGELLCVATDIQVGCYITSSLIWCLFPCSTVVSLLARPGSAWQAAYALRMRGHNHPGSVPLQCYATMSFVITLPKQQCLYRLMVEIVCVLSYASKTSVLNQADSRMAWGSMKRNPVCRRSASLPIGRRRVV